MFRLSEIVLIDVTGLEEWRDTGLMETDGFV